MDHTEGLKLHLPKLPELDKDDIKAIRGFLPGKVLGRTAVLLSLMVLVLLYAGVANQILRMLLADLGPASWAWFGLLFGLPMLCVFWQLSLEWHSRRKRRILQRLAVQASAVPARSFRIGPYLDTDEDRKLFDRADRAHEKVLRWIEQSNALPLYLTGDSGSGKSSLLNASVLPALRARSWIVVEARAFQDPETMLRNAFLALAGAILCSHGWDQTLRSLLEAAAKRATGGLLVVLDQFEEFVILAKAEERAGFIALLTSLRETPVPGVRMLLSLRSDYESLLEDCGLPTPKYGENLFQVGRFTFPAATAFLAGSGLGLQPDAVTRLLTSVATLDETPGLVRPITLNVIGYVLATGQTAAESLDAGQLIQGYIAQTISQSAIRDHAPLVLEKLVTEQATKRPCTEDELAAGTGLRRGEIRAVLNSLAAAALARPLDAAQCVWALSHDFIARAVTRTLGRRPRDRLRHGAFYAAPALLATAVLIGVGMVAWDRLIPYLIAQDLANLGLTVRSVNGDDEIEGTSALTAENFAQSGSLLERLAPHERVRLLNLRFRNVANLEPLKTGTALRSLDLANTRVTKLEPLQNMTALQSLNLYYTRVARLEPLKDMIALQWLNLSNTSVTSLEPLKDMTALQWLDLSDTQIANLEPLKEMTALQSLNLYYTQVEKLEPLKDMIALQTLNLSYTHVANLEPLKSMTALQSLTLSNTPVEDLRPLKGMVALQSLDLSNTPVANVGPLKDITSIQSLDLSRTKVTDLSRLQLLPHLIMISIDTATDEERERFARVRRENNLPKVFFPSDVR